MTNRERPHDAAQPERLDVFEGLKQEIISLGLFARTPEDLSAFQERARGFIESDAPIFLKGEMLKILETQAQSRDVQNITERLKRILRDAMTEQGARSRREEMERYAKFAGDVEDPERVAEMIDMIDAYLALEGDGAESQSLTDMSDIGDEVVREAEVEEMRRAAEQPGGSGVAEQAEEFLRRTSGE